MYDERLMRFIFVLLFMDLHFTIVIGSETLNYFTRGFVLRFEVSS